MARLLYYEIRFVALHQKKPADWENIGASSPNLSIGDIETSTGKYTLTTGTGDPGEDPNLDWFDFPEFQTGALSFERPEDWGASISYQTELLTASRAKYGVVSVPDDYLIPDEYRIIVAEYVVDAALDALEAFATARGLTTLRALLDTAEEVLEARSLYNVIADHMDRQFTLIDKITAGEISVGEFLNESDAHAAQFTGDLLDEAGVPLGEAQALANMAFRVHEYTGFGFYNSETGVLETQELMSYAPTGEFGGVEYQGRAIREGFTGTPSYDSAYLGGGDDFAYGADGDDYLNGGEGDDLLVGGAGSDWIVGGEGQDTAAFRYGFADYEIVSSGRFIMVTGEGHDGLEQIERLRFADGDLVEADGDRLVSDLFYFSNNLDVWNYSSSETMPEQHYSSTGWREGRDPNPHFSTNGYLSANPDVADAAISPLLHYQLGGWLEGRDPSASFDTDLYLLNNPDVRDAGLNPLWHYLISGMAEGRSAHQAIGRTIETNGFDREFYLLENPDVAAAGIDPLMHFMASGWREGRDPNAYFDTDFYLTMNGDVASVGINPLQHYAASGWREGRDPSQEFDTTSYLDAHTDVAAAGMNPLYHFLVSGVYEGRNSFGSDWILG